MARRLLSDKSDNQFQFRMETDLLARYMDILRRAEKLNPRLSEADVNRILAGVDKPDKFVTKEDVELFRTGKVTTQATPVLRGSAEKKASKGTRKRRVNGKDEGED